MKRSRSDMEQDDVARLILGEDDDEDEDEDKDENDLFPYPPRKKTKTGDTLPESFVREGT